MGFYTTKIKVAPISPRPLFKMSDRIEIIYKAADELAQTILHGQIALGMLEPDPNRVGEFCHWPETFLAWKESAKKREADYGRTPLNDLQWDTIEKYLIAQYGFAPIAKGESHETSN